MTGPAMVNIFAPTPKTNPSAAVNIGHSIRKNIYIKTVVWYNEIKRGGYNMLNFLNAKAKAFVVFVFSLSFMGIFVLSSLLATQI